MNIPDIVPKITDIKNLQDLSKLLALPMIMVAYFLQDGSQISLDGNIWFDLGDDLPERAQFARLCLIFILKSLWAGGIFAFCYAIIATLYVESDLLRNIGLLVMISNLSFAFALLGLFGTEKFPILRIVEPFWWYAFIVWGFFLLSMNAQFNEK